MFTRMVAVCAMAAGLALSGCSGGGGSSVGDPLEYLPEAAIYFGVDSETVTKGAGAKRLADAFAKIQPSQAPITSGRFVGAMNPPKTPTGSLDFFGVATGPASDQARMIDTIKSQGAKEGKYRNFTSYEIASGGQSMMLVPVSEGVVLTGSGAGAITSMVQTSEKKSPAALNSPTFRLVRDEMKNHALVVGVNAAAMKDELAAQSQILKSMNPRAAQALEKLEHAALYADWDDAPRFAAFLAINDEALSKEVETTVQQAVGMASMLGGDVPPIAKDLLKSLKVSSSASGVNVEVTFPKAIADQFLTRIEQLTANLPTDPQQREQAVAMGMLQIIMEMGSQLGAAPGATSGAMPGAEPQAMTPEQVQQIQAAQQQALQNLTPEQRQQIEDAQRQAMQGMTPEQQQQMQQMMQQMQQAPPQ